MTHDPARAISPAWSPDGTMIAFKGRSQPHRPRSGYGRVQAARPGRARGAAPIHPGRVLDPLRRRRRAPDRGAHRREEQAPSAGPARRGDCLDVPRRVARHLLGLRDRLLDHARNGTWRTSTAPTGDSWPDGCRILLEPGHPTGAGSFAWVGAGRSSSSTSRPDAPRPSPLAKGRSGSTGRRYSSRSDDGSRARSPLSATVEPEDQRGACRHRSERLLGRGGTVVVLS